MPHMYDYKLNNAGTSPFGRVKEERAVKLAAKARPLMRGSASSLFSVREGQPHEEVRERSQMGPSIGPCGRARAGTGTLGCGLWQWGIDQHDRGRDHHGRRDHNRRSHDDGRTHDDSRGHILLDHCCRQVRSHSGLHHLDEDSGLFDVLIPAFSKAYPQYNVKVVAVGSGQALTLGQNGDADVLLVHSPAAELTFMSKGYGIDRKAVMYNDFIIVGPASDPAKIKGLTSATEAFAKIAAAKALFFTRGDASGTNAAELALWKAAKITPSGSWYVKTGQGMGQTLTITDQKGGYTLSDRATYLADKSSLRLQILVQGDKALFNQYHVITCKKAKNLQGANDFMNWIVSPDVQTNVIGTYGVAKYGQQLFIPNAGKVQ